MTAIQPIDKDFLESVLKEPIQDFKVGEGCKAGDNVAGSLKSITVRTAKNEQKHFVFKQFPEHMTQENSFVVFSKAFWRENAVYKTLFPKLEAYAKSQGFDYTAPAPKYFKGYNDDKHDYILLEDVRPSGYRMPDKTISLTLEEMSLIMAEFAKLHAVGFAYLRDQGERVFQEIDGFQYLYRDAFTIEILEKNYDAMIIQFYHVATSLLEDRFPEGAKKMKEYEEKHGKLRNTMDHLTDTKCFPVFCHYDLWSNNMLIKHDKNGKPVGVTFIDYQFLQRGNLYTDLLYLVYTSTTPEFRKKHHNTILNVYYDTFCETMDKLNVPMPWGFTRGTFLDQYEAGIMTGFVRMTFAIPLQLGMITVTKKENEDEAADATHSDAGIRKMYEDSPKAMERLESLVKELIELKLL